MITEIKEGSFIYEIKNALKKSDCQNIIRRFEEDKEHQVDGLTGSKREVNKLVKASTDLAVIGDEWVDVDHLFFKSLADGINQISKVHNFFDAYHLLDLGYQIQRTEKGEFYKWHSDAGPAPMSERQLVAIWYLNDVEKGGQTQFLHQGVNVDPEEGKLILFPPFWTHIHQGQEVEEGVKYISTTWLQIDNNLGVKTR